MAPHQWYVHTFEKLHANRVCLIKDKNLSNTLKECPRFEVTNHPLRTNLVSMVHTNSKSVEEVDPLSVIEGGDPLSTFVQESLVTEAWIPFAEDVAAERDDDGVKAWNSRRTSILNKYTTVEKLSIISSFLPGGEKMMIKQSSNVSEQLKHRLEQLDQFEEGSVRKTMGLTQQEYTSRISLLNNELVQAWNSEQRVKALKIAIQCSKMLVDTSVMQFYPSKFVLVTDILETFGNLVYERLKGKSYERADIPKYLSDVDPDQVPESAKETCQNWLYKMASIRELVPRLYIEMSLLRCYIFLSRNEFDSAIERLTRMIRGVGHPLVALYARCYLCRVALTVITRSRGYFKSNLQEFLQTYTQIFEPSVKRDYKSQALNIDTYLSLYTPPLDWLLYGVMTYGKSIDVFLDELLTKSENLQNKELLLYCVISSFDSYKISNKAAKILELIASSESNVLRQEMVLLVGERVCGAAGAGGGAAGEALVQAAWKLLHVLPALPHFLRALEPWMHFACVHLSPKHINILLRGILKYITKSYDSIADYSHLLQAIIKRMLANIEDVEELFLMDGFMPLLDIIQAAPAQIEMSKAILNSFVSRDSCLVISDHIVIGTVMRLCRVLHDSMNALTVEDEQKLTSELISKFVQSVSHHDDYEQQLAFYVDCRSAFINLDPVLVTLVHCVNRLAARAGGGGGGGTRLVRACAAYCFITVPSLPCPLLKAQLYLLTAQVALLNTCIGQAEACMKLSISIIPEIPEKHLEDGQMKSTQIKVHSLLSNFLSTLLVMPDNVEANCKLYLLKGVLKAIELLSWERTDSLFYSVLLDVLDLLCNLAQETYSYHIESVVSNDLLYGSDKEFINEVDRLSTAVSEELLTILKRLGDERQFKKQLNLSLELFWRVVRRGDLGTPQMETLAANLWLLSKKHQDQDVKLSKNLITTLKKENEKTKVYVNLLAKIKG